jgi:hypothetical protein
MMVAEGEESGRYSLRFIRMRSIGDRYSGTPEQCGSIMAKGALSPPADIRRLIDGLELQFSCLLCSNGWSPGILCIDSAGCKDLSSAGLEAMRTHPGSQGGHRR